MLDHHTCLCYLCQGWIPSLVQQEDHVLILELGSGKLFDVNEQGCHLKKRANYYSYNKIYLIINRK